MLDSFSSSLPDFVSTFLYLPCCLIMLCFFFFFFFNDTATTEIYTLSLHDALPIWGGGPAGRPAPERRGRGSGTPPTGSTVDRKSTRLNSSQRCISYAVFCLKKKKK